MTYHVLIFFKIVFPLLVGLLELGYIRASLGLSRRTPNLCFSPSLFDSFLRRGTLPRFTFPNSVEPQAEFFLFFFFFL